MLHYLKSSLYSLAKVPNSTFKAYYDIMEMQIKTVMMVLSEQVELK